MPFAQDASLVVDLVSRHIHHACVYGNDGIGLDDLGPYCSGGDNPPIGQWETCAVPLSAFKLTNPIILKFSIGDETGLARNKFYLDEVGFQ